MADALKQNRLKTLITEPDKHDKVSESTILELHNSEHHLKIMPDKETESETVSIDQEQIKNQFEIKLAAAMQEKASAEHEARRLAEEVESLRSVMEEHIDHLQSAQTNEDEAENAALKRELQLIREQAKADILHLQQQLNKAESKAATDREAVAGKASKEMESLQKALLSEKEHLEISQKELSQLKQHLEDRDKEIKHFKVELNDNRDEVEEAQFHRKEAETARKQVEEALYGLREQIETEKLKNEFKDKRLSMQQQTTEVGSERAGLSVKATLIGVLAGLILGVGLAAIVTLSDDPGKIVQAVSEEDAIAIHERDVSGRPPNTSNGKIEAKPGPQALDTDRNKIAGRKFQIGASKIQRVDVIQDSLQVGGNTPAMIWIQGGVFTMGNTRSQIDIEEIPAHSVKIKSFLISQYEVTFKEYEQFARATGRRLPASNGWGRGNRPVINVSWHSAATYAKWLSRQTGKTYRLATEAEWEYAAAGGTDSPYWWGYKLGKGNASCFNCGSKWDGRSPAPVGSFKPNDYGVYNTAGNVMEWVQDCYHANYRGAPQDGSAWLDASCNKRVVRGGSFNKPGDSLRTTRRRGEEANIKHFAVGFRVVRDL